MADVPRLAVVAVGGNALIRDKDHLSIADQFEQASVTAKHIADMIEGGWNVIITHGNGPQMGFILRRSELSIHEVAPVPMDYAGADLQGAIGYMFVKAFHNEFRRRGLNRQPVAVVTETLVDPDDPAFKDPSKPIGSHMDEMHAKELAARQGWVVKEDAGRGWRRVVASPMPRTRSTPSGAVSSTAWTPMLRIPSRRAVRAIRTAISPRSAISRARMAGAVANAS